MDEEISSEDSEIEEKGTKDKSTTAKDKTALAKDKTALAKDKTTMAKDIPSRSEDNISDQFRNQEQRQRINQQNTENIIYLTGLLFQLIFFFLYSKVGRVFIF